jgi:hypothetical protein
MPHGNIRAVGRPGLPEASPQALVGGAPSSNSRLGLLGPASRGLAENPARRVPTTCPKVTYEQRGGQAYQKPAHRPWWVAPRAATADSGVSAGLLGAWPRTQLAGSRSGASTLSGVGSSPEQAAGRSAARPQALVSDAPSSNRLWGFSARFLGSTDEDRSVGLLRPTSAHRRLPLGDAASHGTGLTARHAWPGTPAGTPF